MYPLLDTLTTLPPLLLDPPPRDSRPDPPALFTPTPTTPPLLPGLPHNMLLAAICTPSLLHSLLHPFSPSSPSSPSSSPSASARPRRQSPSPLLPLLVAATPCAPAPVPVPPSSLRRAPGSKGRGNAAALVGWGVRGDAHSSDAEEAHRAMRARSASCPLDQSDGRSEGRPAGSTQRPRRR
eukprot:871543-Prorocentrum_minimum.AAC.2